MSQETICFTGMLLSSDKLTYKIAYYRNKSFRTAR